MDVKTALVCRWISLLFFFYAKFLQMGPICNILSFLLFFFLHTSVLDFSHQYNKNEMIFNLSFCRSFMCDRDRGTGRLLYFLQVHNHKYHWFMHVALRDVNVSVGCGVCGPSCVLESGLGSGDAGGAWIKRDLGDPGVSDDQSEPRLLSAHLQHRWRHPRTEITHLLHALKPNKPWCECIKAWVL